MFKYGLKPKGNTEGIDTNPLPSISDDRGSQQLNVGLGVEVEVFGNLLFQKMAVELVAGFADG